MNPPTSNAAVPMMATTTPMAILAVVDKPPDEVLEELDAIELDVTVLVPEGEDEVIELEMGQSCIPKCTARRRD